MSISIIIGGYFVHNPALDDITRLVQSPHLRIELNRPDVLTFTMPPDNVRFGKVQKRKDTVVVNIDGIEYFRGQVVDERPNIYNMREYTCEGTLSFFSDSIHRPISITGNENLTAKAHFVNLITEHNEQVEASKRFVIGTVDASEKVMQKEDTDYATTLSAIEQQLVNRYGGFLRVRRVNDINYIDWLKELTEESTQAVEFGQNIVDLDGLIDTREIGSVLIPLGARVNGKKLTIADVNGGSDSIESAELIQKYGRVVITKEFPTIKDANELLSKAREALSEMEDDETFDITAVDLSRLGVDVSALRVGLLTPIVAPRHGIEKSKILYAADMDLENIENSVYTFGVPRQTLTEALAETARGGGGVGKKIDELSDIITDAYINIDQMKGDIELRAYQDEMNTRFSEAWIGINGVRGTVEAKADQTTVDELGKTVTEVYARLDGPNGIIETMAKKEEVEDLEKTVTTVSINLDAAIGVIEQKASIETVNALGTTVANVSTRMDAVEGSITSLTQKQEEIDGEILDLESSITQNAGSITALSKTVDENGETLNSAVLRLDGVEGDITAQAKTINFKADKTYVDNLVADKLTATNLAAEIAKIEKLSLQRVSGSIAEFSALTATNFAIGDVQMSSRALTMGDVVSTSVLTSKGSAIDLAHSHAVTVNPDGTITLGEVSATGGNFRIADTQAYKDGVSAAMASVTLSSAGWVSCVNTVTASNGKTYPVSLPAFSVSGGTSFNSEHKTTVLFSTASVSTPLETVPVDASSVYEEGYEAGWAKARKEIRLVKNSAGTEVYVRGPAEAVDTSAQLYKIALNVGITSHVHNAVAGTITANASGSVVINNATQITKTASSTINANSGIM